MRARRAVSLLELMLAMSACALILTTSAALIHRVMRAQSKTRSFFDVERSSLRLSGYFRRDVHQASEAETEGADLGAEVFLRLRLPHKQTAEYRHVKGSVLRILSEGDKVLSREEFAFPSDIELAIRQDDSPRMITLTITAQPVETAQPAETSDGPSQQQMGPYFVPVSFEAAATLNRESVFTPPSAGQETPQ